MKKRNKKFSKSNLIVLGSIFGVGCLYALSRMEELPLVKMDEPAILIDAQAEMEEMGFPKPISNMQQSAELSTKAAMVEAQMAAKKAQLSQPMLSKSQKKQLKSDISDLKKQHKSIMNDMKMLKK